MISLNKLKQIKWYRQSGAGIPLCVGMPFIGLSERMYKRSGLYFPNDLGIFLKTGNNFTFYHYFDYFLTYKELKKIFNKISSDIAFFEKLKNAFYPAGEKMEETGLDLLNYSIIQPEFIKKYGCFLEYTQQFWENSLFIDLLDPFENEIIDFIFGKQRTKIDKKDLNILLSPDKLSNFQKYQKKLLDVYAFALKNGVKSSSVKDKIKRISRAYYWLNNDYESVEYLDEKYFTDQLKKLLSDKKEVEYIKNALDKFENVKMQKREIVKKYYLSERTKKMLDFFNWVISYRDDRKKYNQINNYVLIEVINKISSELNINLEILKYAIPDEIPTIIRKDKIIINELKKRDNYGILVFAGKSSKLKVLSGKISKKYFNIVEKTIQASEIKGTTACPGKVIGTVKLILNQNDFSKMKQGDVIVASMTRPEYVSIMKMASAIVTDEGGITCHAAIVSRELGIPCITSTQVASKSLHDGDLVDVIADHGLIKIVKRSGK